MTTPSFALSVFHVKSHQPQEDRINAENDLTRKLYERLSTRKDIQLTKTSLNNVLCIRFAVGAAKTDKKHIEDAFNLILDETQRVLGREV